MPDSQLVPIYQHRAQSGQDRYYCDIQIPNNYGWGEGIEIFRAYNSQIPGTIPIYRHQTTFDIDRYYYDTKVHNDYGWKDGEVLCYAHLTPQPGTIPIYQHSAPNPERYFLDTQIRNDYGWSSGLVLCYVYPAAIKTLVDDIVGILGWQGANYKGMTYLDTRDNKFTLLDTPRLWDKSPTVPNPIPACEDFLTNIQSIIGSAQFIVDITLLWQSGQGLPGGKFQEAISAGLKGITNSRKRPLVRILIGIPTGIVVMPADVRNWLQATIELHNNLKDVPYTIQIACSKQSIESWNHSKIIAADGVRAIVGGHNLWADNYLGPDPVHDVSGLIEGSAVACLHGFCDALWTRPAIIPPSLVLSNGIFTGIIQSRKDGPRATPGNGTTRMLSLGRLGFGLADGLTVTTNASVSARIMAICRAKKTIRISQQSLYCTITGLDGGFDFYTLWAIVKAIQAGVTVQIVVSNDVPLADGGYMGNLQEVVHSLAVLYVADRLGIYHPADNPSRENLDEWTRASLNPPFKGIPFYIDAILLQADCTRYLNELNEKLSVAPLCYSPNVNYWQVGNMRKPAANHAKVYIIDDTHFYIGSDNLYMSGTPHGLQEFGHLIEGQNETQAFIQNYWDKLWKNSSPHGLKASLPHLNAPPTHIQPIH